MELKEMINIYNEYLEKINNICKKFMDNIPSETFLVIDATTGQNGIIQVK